MILTIYEGITLVSSSYCKRKLEELEERNTLAHIQVSDGAMQAYSKTDEYYVLTRSIGRYRDVLSSLNNCFKNLSNEEIIDYVTTQMALKIKEKAITKVTIEVFHESEYTVEFRINNVFSTEVTFKEKVYEEGYYPNDEYDGYNDTAKYIRYAKKTDFLNNAIEGIKNELQKKVPVKTLLEII